MLQGRAQPGAQGGLHALADDGAGLRVADEHARDAVGRPATRVALLRLVHARVDLEQRVLFRQHIAGFSHMDIPGGAGMVPKSTWSVGSAAQAHALLSPALALSLQVRDLHAVSVHAAC